jgi:PAS domain S-box-containing protein
MAEPDQSIDYRALFEALPGAYLLMDLDYRILAANDEYLIAVGGADREQLIGKILFDLIPAGVTPEALRAFADLRSSFERVAASGESETLAPQPYETRLSQRLGGGVRRGYLSVRNAAVRDGAGRVSQLIHWVRDVTESQTAIRNLDLVEEERRTVERRLALALTSGGIGAWDYDGVADKLTWDGRARELLGLSPEEPFTFRMLMQRLHPEDGPKVDTLSMATLDPSGPGALDVTFRLVDDGGTVIRWLEARGRSTFVGPRCMRVTGILVDVTEQRRYESHLRLLINELNHRVKNTLAVVQSIAMQTFGPNAELGAARERFVERLLALSAAHDVLTRENWEGADLDVVVAKALAPHMPSDPARLRLDGASVRVSPRLAVSLALALHELGTNAIKYGALSNAVGVVDLDWSLVGDAEPDLHFRWRESGGPSVCEPTRRGFGLRLLERVLADDIGGQVALGFAPEGLSCVVTAPASAWRAASTPLAPTV